MRIAVAIGFILLLCQCKRVEDRSCFKLSGKTNVVVRAINPFKIIEIYDNIDVTIFQSNRNEIEIEAGKNLLNFITLKQDGNTTQLRNTNKCNFFRDEKKRIKVKLFISDFSKLVNEGYGDIFIPEKFTTTKLYFANFSYGNLDLNVNLSDSLILNLASENQVLVKGSANTLYAYMVGGNYLKALDLNAVKTGSVFAYSNVDIYLAVDSVFFVNQFGKGTVYYKGSPKIISRTPNAKIIKLN